ncbi:MAG TPA: NAD(P)-binding domain-containing protein [Rectinemataceae bacterium]|nr:NAD(P)-binding domain-containing protein [Rectinemataceae bacterium]
MTPADREPGGTIAVLGLGAIGSALAAELAHLEGSHELVLAARSGARARAKAADLYHASPLGGLGAVRGCALEELSGADLVVIAAGVLPPETGTRSDALAANVNLYRQIVPALAERNPDACLVVVANPVDAMVHAARILSGFPPDRVIGTGTLLDTIRLRAILARELGLRPGDVAALVIGEHGDSMLPLWSRARAGDRPLAEYASAAGLEFDPAFRSRVMHELRRAGWEIRAAGEHSAYAIARCAAAIVRALLSPGATVLPVSRCAEGVFGLGELCLSLPVALGAGAAAAGSAARPEEFPLSDEEGAGLQACARALRPLFAEVDAMLAAD